MFVSTNAHDFTRGAQIIRAQQPMTMEALRRAAPSVFAESAHDSRSARYAYVATQEILAGLSREGFAVYSGDDPTAVALMLCGGQGNISVSANVAPKLMHELCVAAIAGDVRRAMEIQFKLLPLHKNMFVEANPIPVKWAMARMKLCGGTMRLPMTPLTQANESVVENALRATGLI